MGAGFSISSLYQTDGVENKELNMSGVTGPGGGQQRWPGLCRPLAAEGGEPVTAAGSAASWGFSSILMAYFLHVTCSASGPCGVDR